MSITPQPLCFVLMPFGIKADPTGLPDIDFNRIYEAAIKPAIEAAGMIPLRADEGKTGRIIFGMKPGQRIPTKRRAISMRPSMLTSAASMRTSEMPIPASTPLRCWTSAPRRIQRLRDLLVPVVQFAVDRAFLKMHSETELHDTSRNEWV